MAPTQPGTPDVAFTRLQTPPSRSHAMEASAGSWHIRYRGWRLLAQTLVVGAIVTYVFGQLFVFTSVYSNGLRVTLNEFWGVPHHVALTNGGGGEGNKKEPVKGHAELVRPTYVVLFGVLPLLVSVILVEVLWSFKVRRLGGSVVLSVARTLRRKPSLFGSLSHWSYGDWIFLVMFLIVGNILAFHFGFSRRLARTKATKKTSLHLNDYLDLIGVTLGFNTIYNMAFLFLPATRNSAWLEFLNISYANAIKYHRWLSVVTVLTATVHCITFYWLWIREGKWAEASLPCFDCPLDEHTGQAVWFNVFGELALLCFLAIAVMSMPIVRRRFFNAFYYTHQLFLVAVVVSVMHWGPVVWWVLPSFVLYLSGRVLSSTNAFTPTKVKAFTALSPNLVKIVLQRAPGRSGHYTVGQFLYLNVPAVSRLQWHAFTIASSAKASPTTATVLVKAVGDWTNELVAHADKLAGLHQLPTVYVDGFYGASLELYEEYSTLCLVGGGIGMTPLVAILDDLTARLTHHQILTQKVVLILSFRELALLEEIAPTITRLHELDPHQQLVVTHLTLTCDATDEMLETKLAKSSPPALPPTQYEDTTRQPRTFAPPLRSSRAILSLAVTTLFAVAVLLVVYLEFGHGGAKIKRQGAELWPLQQFTEIMVVILSSVVVLAYVWVDRVHGARLAAVSGTEPTKELTRESVVSSVTVHATRDSQAFLSHSLQVQTYRELVAELGVVIGGRPDIATLLQETYDHHKNTECPATAGNGLIGAFVSGPEPLKRAVQVAAASIHSRVFDLHEEQFEL